MASEFKVEVAVNGNELIADRKVCVYLYLYLFIYEHVLMIPTLATHISDVCTYTCDNDDDVIMYLLICRDDELKNK